jgi:hypothetical protein
MSESIAWISFMSRFSSSCPAESTMLSPRRP